MRSLTRWWVGPFVLALVALAVGPRDAESWGRDGHRVVCQMAMARLTEGGRALVDALLADEGVGLPDACLWADEVRNTTHRATSAYHYVNVPPDAPSFDFERDCGDIERRCVTWAIPHYALILQDTDQPAHLRAEALKFVAHFVGDLHQPLHAGRPGDLGGNRVEVEFFGAEGFNGGKPNLHWVWDTEIFARGAGGRDWRDMARELGAEIGEDEAAAWADFDVTGWTNESRTIAERDAYTLPDNGVIDEAYYQRAIVLVRGQIQRAAVRLAHVINEAAVARLRN